MIHLDGVLVVEGKFDYARLQRITDAAILTTDGFGIFRNEEKIALLKRISTEKTIYILTDSDRSGMAIRNYLIRRLEGVNPVNLYIPDVFGKEKRKKTPSVEGKIGVEGMESDILERILSSVASPREDGERITKTDLFNARLTGFPDSSARRRAYGRKLGLPDHLSPEKFLGVLNLLQTRPQFLAETEEPDGL